jgi:GrpB-like predicted nucleotidyltransferase (UPF0157 family)
MFPVIVVPYDQAWPGMFDAERAAILSALTGLDPGIEHIGSTSVPGLAAKPKIDILVGLRVWGDLQPAIDCLSGIGYKHGEPGDADRQQCSPGSQDPPCFPEGAGAILAVREVVERTEEQHGVDRGVLHPQIAGIAQADAGERTV